MAFSKRVGPKITDMVKSAWVYRRLKCSRCYGLRRRRDETKAILTNASALGPRGGNGCRDARYWTIIPGPSGSFSLPYTSTTSSSGTVLQLIDTNSTPNHLETWVKQ